MVLLPILLTLILGVSLSSVFNDDNSSMLAASEWFYQIEDSDSGEKFEEFLDTYNSQLNIELTEQQDKDVALQAVADLEIDGYLVYTEDLITVYVNEHASDSTKWLEIVFDNYMDRAAIIEGIVEDSTDITLLQFVQDNSMDVKNHVEALQIESVRQPDAIGYYAIAMLTLTSCYSLIVLILGLNEEKRRNTLKRYLLSGKSFFSFLFSKSLSVCCVLFVELAVVMLFDTLVYQVDFGDIRCWLTVLAATIVFTFLVTQVGVFLSLLFQNLSALNIILNTVVLPVVLFFGGAYLHFYKLIGMGLEDVLVYSPVYHINKGLFDAIYLGDYTYILVFCLVAFAISLDVLVINRFLAKWRGNSWVQ
jgi:ABC-2 type transport system permease protein